MLRLYISYAPADRPYLDKLLKWLKPLEERYALQLWYADPAKASLFLYHRYHAPGPVLYFPADWEKMVNRLMQAHIYLFLVSHNSLSTPYVEQEEVPRAVDRYIKYGEDFVQVLPVLLSPSQWDKHSRLSEFPALSGSLPLTESDSEEEGFHRTVTQLQIIVEKLQRNWMEEKHRLGLGEKEDGTPELLPAAPAGFKPLPGWVGMAMLMSVFYLVTSFYLRSCAPRMYHMYVPETVPYQPPPDRYLRENPLTPPEDVPLRPE